MTKLIEKVVGELGDKRRWRAYKARVKALPASHRTAVEALEQYLSYFGAITKGDIPQDVLMSMFEDLADKFEQTDGTPVQAVVGDEPVEFAEAFFREYSDGQWVSKDREPSLSAIEREFYQEIERGIGKERARLAKAIAAASDRETRS